MGGDSPGCGVGPADSAGAPSVEGADSVDSVHSPAAELTPSATQTEIDGLSRTTERVSLTDQDDSPGLGSWDGEGFDDDAVFDRTDEKWDAILRDCPCCSAVMQDLWGFSGSALYTAEGEEAADRSPARSDWHGDVRRIVADETHSLILVGLIHQFGDDKQSRAFMSALGRWIINTHIMPRIIVVEGRVPEVSDVRDGRPTDRAEIGDAAYAAFLEGIQIMTLEEDNATQARAVAETRDPEVVFAYYVSRNQPQIYQPEIPVEERPDPDERMRYFAEQFAFLLEPGLDPVEEYVRIMQELYPDRDLAHPFSEEQVDLMLTETVAVITSDQPESPMQDVAGAVNARRDVAAATTLVALRQQGYAVFAVIGDPHVNKVVRMVPELKDQVIYPLVEGEGLPRHHGDVFGYKIPDLEHLTLAQVLELPEEVLPPDHRYPGMGL